MTLPFRKYAIGQIDADYSGTYQRDVNPALDVPVVVNQEKPLPYSDPNDPSTWKGEGSEGNNEYLDHVNRTETKIWIGIAVAAGLLWWALSD